MTEIKSCETCAYIGKGENDYPCNKCTRNASDNWQAMTKADRIRAMSDEEMAEFINKFDNICGMCSDNMGCFIVDADRCKNNILKWLQSEADIPKSD